MNKGHFRLLVILGIVTLWSSLRGHNLFLFILGLLEVIVGLLLQIDIEIDIE